MLQFEAKSGLNFRTLNYCLRVNNNIIRFKLIFPMSNNQWNALLSECLRNLALIAIYS